MTKQQPDSLFSSFLECKVAMGYVIYVFQSRTPNLIEVTTE